MADREFNPESPLDQALCKLNWHRGRGNIIAIDEKRGTFTRQGFHMRPESRRYSIKLGRVYALRSSRSLAKESALIAAELSNTESD